MVALGQNVQNRGVHFNRIKAKHIDYILCDSESLKPLLAIELDDKTHLNPNRKKIDSFKDEVLDTAGIPILRVTVKRNYDPIELNSQIQSKIY